MYVIRIGPTSVDTNYLSNTLRPEIEEHMRQAYGLLDHMVPQLHVVMREEDDQWFVAYFDPERQTEALLTADLNLLSWGFQRHEVQICPVLKLHNAALRSDLTRAGRPLDRR